MSGPALVVRGEVVLRATRSGLRRAEAVALAGGRVTAAGSFADVRAAVPGARVVDARGRAVVPGIHDAHLHLVGLARARAAVDLDAASTFAELLALVAGAAAELPDDAWLTGRGWRSASLDTEHLDRLEAAVGGRPAYLGSHDGHSAWASASALARAGVGPDTADPPGGRYERRPDGSPNGVLRETALEGVSAAVPRLEGDPLRVHLAAAVAELNALGITGATEAGDYTADNGIGPFAALGDSFSNLAVLADVVDGRLRMNLGIPAAAIDAAAAAGQRTGATLGGTATLRFGWAKAYADGALGSGTAALFEPATCGARDAGILRIVPEQLTAQIAGARRAGIAMAIHAIGDRAVASVLDAIEAAPEAPGPGVPPERIEHVQLLRADDVARLARVGVLASVQPIHAAADRHMVEACWQGRQARAFPWRSLVRTGALLAFGSDAPVESPNPWVGLFAALHRRLPGEPGPDWRKAESVDAATALTAYTTGSGAAAGAADVGHLEPGARADLAVLDVDLEALLRADERLASVRVEATIVGGRLVHGW